MGFAMSTHFKVLTAVLLKIQSSLSISLKSEIKTSTLQLRTTFIITVHCSNVYT